MKVLDANMFATKSTPLCEDFAVSRPSLSSIGMTTARYLMIFILSPLLFQTCYHLRMRAFENPGGPVVDKVILYQVGALACGTFGGIWIQSFGGMDLWMSQTVSVTPTNSVGVFLPNNEPLHSIFVIPLMFFKRSFPSLLLDH